MTEEEAGYRLAHPVYLDVPMMISFLAYLEGGVAASEEETAREAGARERALKGRAGLRFQLPLALKGDAGTEGSAQRRDEVSFEWRTARHHTEASLFNQLYQYLHEDSQLVVLSHPDQLSSIRCGHLVELEGEYLGNPLEDILAFFGSILPYLSEHQEAQKAAASEAVKRAQKGKRSGDPAVRKQSEDIANQLTEIVETLGDSSNDALGKQLFLRMVEDISRAPVHDLLLRTASGLQAVLTVSSEFYSRETNEYLRAGEFRVVGKITRMVNADNPINLTRRTVLGAGGPTFAQELIASVQGEELQLDVADPIVTAPAVQVLPMAIFL